MKFGIGTLYSKLSLKREFRENRLSDSHKKGKVIPLQARCGSEGG